MMWGNAIMAQPGFFGLGQTWLPLTPSAQQWLVTLHQPQPDSVWAQLSHPNLQEAWSTHPIESRHIMLRWRQAIFSEVDSLFLLHLIGLDTHLVARVDPAYALPDDQVVGLLPRLVLRFRSGLDPALLYPTLSQRPEVQSLESLLNGAWRVHTHALSDLWSLQDWLWQQGWPSWCQPDFLVRMMPADPYAGEQFFLHNTGQWVDGLSATSDIDIDAPEAWALEQGDSSVIVAVFDNGLEAHEDLETPAGNSRVLPGYSVIGGSNGAPLIGSESHGMGCVGLIAASHNGLGVQGVAPRVSLLPIYTPLSLSVSIADIANGLTWAWQTGGADVINCSWALPTCDATGYPVLVQAIRDALTFGRGGYGTVLVFAAGNDTLNCVRFPAMMDSTIGVGAIDLQGNPSVYANRGLALDVVAPSSGMGDNVRTIDRVGADGVNINGTNDLLNLDYTRNFGGTSSATSLTSGVVGLLLSAYPNLMAYDVQQILRDAADDMGPPGLDADYGYGRLNAFASLNEASAYGPLAQADWGLQASVSEQGVHLQWQGVPADGTLQLVRRYAQQHTEVARWAEGPRPHQFVDQPLAAGWNLYRLRHVDQLSNEQHSRWVRVDWQQERDAWFGEFARRSSGWHWRLPATWQGGGVVRLFDLTGREVYRQPLANTKRLEVSLPRPAQSGHYVLQLQDAQGRRQHRRVRW